MKLQAPSAPSELRQVWGHEDESEGLTGAPAEAVSSPLAPASCPSPGACEGSRGAFASQALSRGPPGPIVRSCSVMSDS